MSGSDEHHGEGRGRALATPAAAPRGTDHALALLDELAAGETDPATVLATARHAVLATLAAVEEEVKK